MWLKRQAFISRSSGGRETLDQCVSGWCLGRATSWLTDDPFLASAQVREGGGEGEQTLRGLFLLGH